MKIIKGTLKNHRTADPSKIKTDVVITLDENFFTCEFFCENSQLYSFGNTYNSDIFEGDVCEVFICTDGSRKNYYEIEVAPNNCVFFAKIKNTGDGDIDVNLIEENVIVSQVETKDNGYNCKFSVPLNKIGYDKEKGLLFNAFRIETEGGIRDKHLLSLKPACDNTFHRPDHFIYLKDE